MRSVSQSRNILITNKNIYNFRETGFITNALSLFNSSAKVKRKISLKKVEGIVYSEMSNEFMFYVPSEFDYRFMNEKKDVIIMYLLYGMTMSGIKSVPFFFTKEVELHQFTTHNSQKNNGIINKPPQDRVKMFGVKDFEEYVKEKLLEKRRMDENT